MLNTTAVWVHYFVLRLVYLLFFFFWGKVFLLIVCFVWGIFLFSYFILVLILKHFGLSLESQIPEMSRNTKTFDTRAKHEGSKLHLGALSIAMYKEINL